MSIQTLNEPNNPSRVTYSKGRSLSFSRQDMPIQPRSTSLSSSFPSLMSAFGAGSNHYCGGRESSLGTKIMTGGHNNVNNNCNHNNNNSYGRSSSSSNTSNNPSTHKDRTTTSTTATAPHMNSNVNHPPATDVTTTSSHFLPRHSVSSVASSPDSSPTTTTSTFDSPTAVETSPSSSPESPSTSALPSFKPNPHENSQKASSDNNDLTPRMSLGPEPKACANGSTQDQPDSPTRKARNLKNLSLRLPSNSSSRPMVATAPFGDSTRHASAPSSPVHPNTRSSRRRPPNLTIQTPTLDRSFSSTITEVVPPTPGGRPSLRHIESSPSLQSIISPTVTSFPNRRPLPNVRDSSIPQTATGTTNHTCFTTRETLQELEEEDGLASRESCQRNERGYPNGPIQIYSGVYLYLEPTREEAMKFDVVFNVAKEINNPFRNDSPKQDTVMSVWKASFSDPKQQLSVEQPDTAMSDVSFKSAFEFLPKDSDSPITPRTDNNVEPEYIHVPWDHNSEILEDLLPLCEIIDDRVSKGKQVLIHCQLGVSRSASLVIAYGLYKNLNLDFNAMYGIVKERSCWVGPNMSLIYQLTDFRSRIRQGSPLRTPPFLQWFGASETPEANKLSGASTISGRMESSKQKPSIPIFTQPSEGSSDKIKAAPSSNPLSPPPFQQRNVLSRPLPLREKYQNIHAVHRPRTDTSSKHHRVLSRPSVQMDLVMQDVPSTPSVLSPRAAEFWTKPFSRTVAGDLAFEDQTSPSTGGIPDIFSRTEDPRSPQLRREPLIMRNIDEFL